MLVPASFRVFWHWERVFVVNVADLRELRTNAKCAPHEQVGTARHHPDSPLKLSHAALVLALRALQDEVEIFRLAVELLNGFDGRTLASWA